AVDQAQNPEQRLRDPPQEAVVDGQLQAGGDGLQAILQFRSGIEISADGRLLAGRYTYRGADEADDVVALAVLAGLVDMLLFSAGYPGADEIMLQPGDPATIHGLLQAGVIHLA